MHRTPQNILLVDDQDSTRQLLQNNLAMLKDEADLHSVIWSYQHANNAVQAIKSFNQYQPALVFLDIELPDQSGLYLLEKFKDINKDCFVVMVSGVSTLENVRTSMKSGASSFIVKPFTGDKILSVLKQYDRYLHQMKK